MLAAGCASVKEPVIGRERVAAKPVQMQKVLVVVDYRLDSQAVGPTRAQVFLKTIYGNLGQTMADAVTAAGGTPTVIYVKEYGDDKAVESAEYSHVWLQRVTHLMAITQSYVTFSQNREWHSSIAHRATAGAPLSTAYEMNYQSDGVVCFSNILYANKEECRNQLRDLVTAQLRKYRQSP